jgi:hypothetical protein
VATLAAQTPLIVVYTNIACVVTLINCQHWSSFHSLHPIQSGQKTLPLVGAKIAFLFNQYCGTWPECQLHGMLSQIIL